MTQLRVITRLLGAVLSIVLSAALGGASLVAPFVSPPVKPSAARFAVSAAAPLWLPPLESPLLVSGPYRAPPSPYASGHRGIDLPAGPGDAVRAPVAGTVSFVGRVVDRPVLSIRVDARTILSFEPLDASDLNSGMDGEGLSEGDSVYRGQLLGVIAEGGHCESECVHLGVRVDGEYVNPMRFFVEKPILLPW